jgi:hypothetical protein
MSSWRRIREDLRLSSPGFARRVAATIRDSNGDLIKGASITWWVNGIEVGSAVSADGHSSIEVGPQDEVAVGGFYGDRSFGPEKLANDQQAYEFRVPIETHPMWRQFFMKHFPAIIGIVFMLLAIALVVSLSHPTPLQAQLILATFALGGGGFAGEIAGKIDTTLTLGKKLVVSAGGAAAFFVILYFFVPAMRT